MLRRRFLPTRDYIIGTEGLTISSLRTPSAFSKSCGMETTGQVPAADVHHVQQPEDDAAASSQPQTSQESPRRSWRALGDIFKPFSSTALASLPRKPQGFRQRATRADRIPTTEPNDGEQPTVRDYHSINSIPPHVRVPKKIATPIMVEPKVWCVLCVNSDALIMLL